MPPGHPTEYSFDIINSIWPLYRLNVLLLTSVVSWKIMLNIRPKRANYIPVFRPKRPQNHDTLWGGTYLDGLPYLLE